MCENFIQGKDSSDDEDLNDMPDDDQYDTEDSFIDDAELVCFPHTFTVHMDLSYARFQAGKFPLILFLQDEYFEVDKATVKHDGFFINKGKLECM